MENKNNGPYNKKKIIYWISYSKRKPIKVKMFKIYIGNYINLVEKIWPKYKNTPWTIQKYSKFSFKYSFCSKFFINLKKCDKIIYFYWFSLTTSSANETRNMDKSYHDDFKLNNWHPSKMSNNFFIPFLLVNFIPIIVEVLTLVSSNKVHVVSCAWAINKKINGTLIFSNLIHLFH